MNEVVAGATLALAVMTGWLAWVTRSMSKAAHAAARESATSAAASVDLARAAERQVRLSIRPLLIGVDSDATGRDDVVFDAPGRQGAQMRADELYIVSHDGNPRVSVPFRNVGAGVAVISGAWIVPEPEQPWGVNFSKTVLAPGDRVRVNVSCSSSELGPYARHRDFWGTEFAVAIGYTDVHCDQRLVTEAVLKEYETSNMSIRQIRVMAEDEPDLLFESGEAQPS